MISAISKESPIPGTNIASSIICGILRWKQQKKGENQQEAIQNTLFNLRDIDDFAELLARRLVQRYELQIGNVADDDIGNLADCAVVRILYYLAQPSPEPDSTPLTVSREERLENFVSSCLYDLATENKKLKQGFLGLMNKSIKLRGHDERKWTENGIFQLPGIMIPKGKEPNTFDYYNGTACDEKTYMWRLGTPEEVHKRNFTASSQEDSVKPTLLRSFGSRHLIESGDSSKKRKNHTPLLERMKASFFPSQENIQMAKDVLMDVVTQEISDRLTNS